MLRTTRCIIYQTSVSFTDSGCVSDEHIRSNRHVTDCIHFLRPNRNKRKTQRAVNNRCTVAPRSRSDRNPTARTSPIWLKNAEWITQIGRTVFKERQDDAWSARVDRLKRTQYVDTNRQRLPRTGSTNIAQYTHRLYTMSHKKEPTYVCL